jgi:hypothetical protein
MTHRREHPFIGSGSKKRAIDLMVRMECNKRAGGRFRIMTYDAIYSSRSIYSEKKSACDLFELDFTMCE